MSDGMNDKQFGSAEMITANNDQYKTQAQRAEMIIAPKALRDRKSPKG
jgi:hypothetical protein